MPRQENVHTTNTSGGDGGYGPIEQDPVTGGWRDAKTGETRIPT